jgi:hypothetical protein
MSDITFRPMKRERLPLLIGLAGGTGSGKTLSALMIARGIAAGQPFAAIDTENGRMSHYADRFPECQVGQIDAPFRPTKYTDAIDAADKFLAASGVPEPNRVVVVDSASHEWYGDGGCLDWQEEIMRGQESRRAMSWIEPKKSHKRMVTRLLRVQAHVVLCFRAEPKLDFITEDGQFKAIPKRTITGGGLNGWVPIAEKNMPFECTCSFMLMADHPGVPLPMKLEDGHKSFVPLDKPLDESVGAALAAWAAGEPSPLGTPAQAADADVDALVEQLLALADIGKLDQVRNAIRKNRDGHPGDLGAHRKWLEEQLARAREALVA